DLFTIFPATLEGLNESSIYLERILDQEDVRPTFQSWRQIFLKPPHEPDVNYRKWRRANDHRKYLTEHPKLYQWLCALAVYPEPTWAITIAIGKALKSKGVEVTFDHLSILARIPWLQRGELHPRLRQELLNELDKETEHLARAAVKTELQAVRDLTQNGHANRSLHTNLAIQNFSIAPKNYDHQQVIQFLIDNKLLNKKQIAALNHSVARHQGATPPTKKTTSGAKAQLQQFLTEQDQSRAPLPKPLVTRHLVQAAATGLLCLLLFVLGISLNKTERLHRLVFGPKTDLTNPETIAYQNNFFFREIPLDDEAKYWNNSGVDSAAVLNHHRQRSNLAAWLSQKTTFEAPIAEAFTKALAINPSYA
ncbi:MAG: hypothetical protein AAGD05_19675, partial [Bacteroidota bacterium]